MESSECCIRGYAVLICTAVVLCIIIAFATELIGLRAARILYFRMLRNVIRAPMRLVSSNSHYSAALSVLVGRISKFWVVFWSSQDYYSYLDIGFVYCWWFTPVETETTLPTFDYTGFKCAVKTAVNQTSSTADVAIGSAIKIFLNTASIII